MTVQNAPGRPRTAEEHREASEAHSGAGGPRRGPPVTLAPCGGRYVFDPNVAEGTLYRDGKRQPRHMQL